MNNIHPANLYYTVMAMNNELQGIKNYQTALSKKISQLKSEHNEMQGNVVRNFHFGGYNSSHKFYPGLSDKTIGGGLASAIALIEKDKNKTHAVNDYTVLSLNGELYLSKQVITEKITSENASTLASDTISSANHLMMQSISFDVLPCEQTQPIIDFMTEHKDEEGEVIPTTFVGDITSSEYAIGCDSTGSAIFYIPYDAEHSGKHSTFIASYVKDGEVCNLSTSTKITSQFEDTPENKNIDLREKFIILKTINISFVESGIKVTTPVRILIAYDNTEKFGITTDGTSGVSGSGIEQNTNFVDETNNWRSIDYQLRVNGEKYRISNSSLIKCWVKYKGKHETAHGLLMYPEIEGARYCRVVLVDAEEEA